MNYTYFINSFINHVADDILDNTSNQSEAYDMLEFFETHFENPKNRSSFIQILDEIIEHAY